MEKLKLLEYLAVVRDLEGIVYVHEQAIKKLNQMYEDISYRVNYNQYEKPWKHSYDSSDVPPQGISACIKKGIILGLGLAILLSIIMLFLSPIFGTIFFGFDVTTDEVGTTYVILLVISLIISVIFGIKIGYDSNEYEYGSEKWQQIEAHNRELEAKNAELRAWDQQQLQLIPQVIKILQKNEDEARYLRRQYYDLGYLHRDYQNMVAVCSIYQYLDSGRCDVLTGRDGAYNLYEEELFKKMILFKLDEIITRLDAIQRTQSQLYHLMRSCEGQIYTLANMTRDLTTSFSSIEQSTKYIEYNTTYLRQNEEYRALLGKF